MVRKVITKKREEVALMEMLKWVKKEEPGGGFVWLHERAMADMIYGRATSSRVKQIARIMRQLQARGLVECREFEGSMGWRLSDK
jgi:hypothetical protein